MLNHQRVKYHVALLQCQKKPKRGMVGIRPIYIHKNSDLNLAPRSARRSGFSGGPNSKSATVRDDESNHLAPSTVEFLPWGNPLGKPQKNTMHIRKKRVLLIYLSELTEIGDSKKQQPPRSVTPRFNK